MQCFWNRFYYQSFVSLQQRFNEENHEPEPCLSVEKLSHLCLLCLSSVSAIEERFLRAGWGVSSSPLFLIPHGEVLVGRMICRWPQKVPIWAGSACCWACPCDGLASLFTLSLSSSFPHLDYPFYAISGGKVCFRFLIHVIN